MAAIPLMAADDAVMTKQLAVERYATALLVRLRRLSGTQADGASTATGTTGSPTRTSRIDCMARPRLPARPVGAASRIIVPDRSLTPDESLPTMAIRSQAGTHQFVYRKMVEGPVGAAAPNHGDIVRVVDRDG